MYLTSIKSLQSQRGAATLLTSVIMLIAITLVTFLTAKSVLEGTKMSANNARAAQALANANAAMDFAFAYVNAGGIDHDNNNFPDDQDVTLDVNADGNHDINAFFTTTANAGGATPEIAFDNNNPLCSTASSESTTMIITTGTSDDGLASRTIQQCVGTPNILKGDGPKQTLVSGAAVGLMGAAQIINRYSDLNVWSANAVTTAGSAIMTYIRPVNLELNDLTLAELESIQTAPTIPNVQVVTTTGLGTGTDVYANDVRLQTAMSVRNTDISNGGDGDAAGSFWDLFFVQSKQDLKTIASESGSYFASNVSDSDLHNKTGIIYVDGTASITNNNTVIGTATDPALLIINGANDNDGTFNFSGGTIRGLVYITGNANITGNPNVLGTFIAEGSVGGTGTLTLVYSQRLAKGGNDGFPGTKSVVSGSWRDW